MAVTADKSVYFCHLEDQGEINKANDTFKIAFMVDTFSFDPDKHKVWDADAWAASTAYTAGDTCKPTTENGYIYRCTVAGTSDATEPTWPDDPGGVDAWEDTVTDGGATWELWSYNTSEDEITQENGYTGPVTLANQAVAEDETNNLSETTFDEVEITASGGSYGPTDCAIIFDDTHAQDPVAGHISFGNSYTPSAGTPITISSIKMQTSATQGASA
jgi:hypothetical protein